MKLANLTMNKFLQDSASAHGRQRQSVLIGHSGLNSLSNTSSALACFFSPVAQYLGFSEREDHVVIATIPILLSTSGPAHVHGPAVSKAFFALAARVIAVVVFAIKAVIQGWTLAKGIVESGKLPKSDADNDAATAVVVVGLMLRIITPLIHARPCAMFRRVIQSVYGAVHFSSASTSLGVAIHKTRAVSGGHVTAATSALPVSVAVRGKGAPQTFNYRHFMEYLLRKVFADDFEWSKFGEKGRIYFGHQVSYSDLMSRGRLAHERLAASFA